MSFSATAGTTLERTDDGTLTLTAPAYRLTCRPDRPYARFDDAQGRAWADLALLASVDAIDGPDEWTRYDAPIVEERPDGPVLTWRVSSARWERERLVLEARDDHIRLHVEIEGDGRLADVDLLAGRLSALPSIGTGHFESGRRFRSLVDPSPTDPARTVILADEPAIVGVVGGSPPGRGRWFFTPGPFAFALALDQPPGPTALPLGPWLAVGLDPNGIDGATFTSFDYRPGEGSWGVRLQYEGHTRVTGSWRSPDLLLIPDAPNPYEAMARASAMTTPRPPPATSPSPWWLEPIFCGWGAQCARARIAGVRPSILSRRDLYDEWLGTLEGHGVVPGTIAIDDKWQATYGRSEPDEDRWPDLRGWIDARHRRGQRVVLWWKAWDAEGLPASLSITNGDGLPVAADPTNPDYDELLRRSIRAMLGRGSGALDADGLKIDFTAMTPSGPSLRTAAELRGDRVAPWGVALLHRLLAIVADEARSVRPDALLIAHTPNALFRDVVSMVRLNDALRLDDPRPAVPVVPQMRHRAAIAAAALPGVPIDTDDWCMPSRAEWLAYLEAKASIGVPALYYVDSIDFSGEAIQDGDLARVAEIWRGYREAVGSLSSASLKPAPA